MNVRRIMDNFPGLVEGAQGVGQDRHPDQPAAQAPRRWRTAWTPRTSARTCSRRRSTRRESLASSRGYIIQPNVVPHPHGGQRRVLDVDPRCSQQRERLGAEARRVWVLNGSGRTGAVGASTPTASRTTGSTRRRRTSGATRPAPTKIVVLQRRRGRDARDDRLPRAAVQDDGRRRSTDPKVTVDIDRHARAQTRRNLAAIDPVG